MIRLNRATEYALISMYYMSRKAEGERLGMATAREVSERYALPYEITAKTLQRLKNKGFIRSFQGAQGGYVLARPLPEVNLADFLRAMEGEGGVVACCSANGEISVEPDCAYSARCEVRPFLANLNTRVFEFLGGITLGDLEAADLLRGAESVPRSVPAAVAPMAARAAADVTQTDRLV